MNRKKQKEIKKLKDWEESGKSWDDFCNPGDLVDEDVYWYFLNVLPPRNMEAVYLQVGEPYSSKFNSKAGRYMATYPTFVRVEDKVWKYCGNCFPGECVDAEYKPVYSDIKEFLKDTYGVKDGMQRTRPRIRCQDGFEMSVQAGSMLYSTPRFNLRDGEYTACEIGFPNREEELIEQYAEDPEDLTETAYAYVPVEVIDEVIKKHGGFERKEGKR